MTNKAEYNSQIASIIKTEEEIFIFKLKDTNAQFDLKEGINQYNFIQERSNQKPFKMLVDTRQSLTLPSERACEFYFKNNDGLNKIALVVDNLAMQVLLNQLFKRKNVGNSKTFKNEDDALIWLKEQILNY